MDLEADFNEEHTSLPKRFRIAQHVLAICLVIVVSWVIVIVTVSQRFDWSLWCGANPVFNVFTAVAGGCAVIGFTIYGGIPIVRQAIINGFNTIPSTWKKIVDSGNTPYFDPAFYKIVDGHYIHVSNPIIGADHYGLPKVDAHVPLNSFNIDIYEKYYDAAKNEYDNVVLNTRRAIAQNSYLSAQPFIHEKVKAYFSLVKEVSRIEVIGETCVLVRSWTGKYLLVHKSDYNPFVADFFRGTGYKLFTVTVRRSGARTLGMISGLLGFLMSINSRKANILVLTPNEYMYRPIFRELQVIVRKGWCTQDEISSKIVYQAILRFLNDRKNVLSYAYLEWATAKHLMRENFIATESSTWKYHTLVNELVQSPQMTMTSFYEAFGLGGSVCDFEKLVKHIDDERPQLIECRNMIPHISINDRNFKNASETFLDNFPKLDDKSLDAFPMINLIPYLEIAAADFGYKDRKHLPLFSNIAKHNGSMGKLKQALDSLSLSSKKVTYDPLTNQSIELTEVEEADVDNSRTRSVLKDKQEELAAKAKKEQDERDAKEALARGKKVEKAKNRLAKERNKQEKGDVKKREEIRKAYDDKKQKEQEEKRKAEKETAKKNAEYLLGEQKRKLELKQDEIRRLAEEQKRREEEARESERLEMERLHIRERELNTQKRREEDTVRKITSYFDAYARMKREPPDENNTKKLKADRNKANANIKMIDHQLQWLDDQKRQRSTLSRMRNMFVRKNAVDNYEVSKNTVVQKNQQQQPRQDDAYNPYSQEDDDSFVRWLRAQDATIDINSYPRYLKDAKKRKEDVQSMLKATQYDRDDPKVVKLLERKLDMENVIKDTQTFIAKRAKLPIPNDSDVIKAQSQIRIASAEIEKIEGELAKNKEERLAEKTRTDENKPKQMEEPQKIDEIRDKESLNESNEQQKQPQPSEQAQAKEQLQPHTQQTPKEQLQPQTQQTQQTPQEQPKPQTPQEQTKLSGLRFVKMMPSFSKRGRAQDS